MMIRAGGGGLHPESCLCLLRWLCGGPAAHALSGLVLVWTACVAAWWRCLEEEEEEDRREGQGTQQHLCVWGSDGGEEVWPCGWRERGHRHWPETWAAHHPKQHTQVPVTVLSWWVESGSEFMAKGGGRIFPGSLASSEKGHMHLFYVDTARRKATQGVGRAPTDPTPPRSGSLLP